MDKAYQSYLERIREFVPEERIYTDDLRRLAWGTDAGFYRLIPKIVVRSKSEEEVARLLAIADDLSLPVTFRAAGTSLSGQAISDSILIVAGKNVVVAGYGWCGKGVAMRAKGLGAEVIVTEVNPIRAMEAVMDGFKVMKMEQAAPFGDIFVTVTGCDSVITERHFRKMKDGAICCNAGHFDVEVDVKGLAAISRESSPARNNIMAYVLEDGRRIYVIAEGRLVNLAAGDGHPAEIMDMSFAIQALSARYLVMNRDSVSRVPGQMVQDVPQSIDEEVARRELASWGCEIDVLTPEQRQYLYGEI